jgi:hypothetical protein
MPERSTTFSLDKLGDLVPVIGGLVSVAYLSGYVNRWAYLREFGAQWLLPQVSIASIVMASFFAIAPLYVLWAYAHIAAPLDGGKNKTALHLLLVTFIAIDVVKPVAAVAAAADAIIITTPHNKPTAPCTEVPNDRVSAFVE